MLASTLRHALLLLAMTVLALHTHQVHAQTTSTSLLLGVGHSSWTGPYVQGGRTGVTLLAVAREWPRTPRFSFRGEVGAGVRSADLGLSPDMDLPRTLNFYRLHLAALGRAYLSHGTTGPHLFAEVGGAVWTRLTCDVNLERGPGFGEETIDCTAWEPSFTDDARPLSPHSAGANFVLGAGGYLGRFGLTLRYETAGTALLESSAGPLHASAVTLAGEWVFHGRHSSAKSGRLESTRPLRSAR